MFTNCQCTGRHHAHQGELPGRAALYRHEDNTLRLNPRHSKYLDDLETVYADVGPGADRRSLARQFFAAEYSFHAGQFVLQAWLFQGQGTGRTAPGTKG